MEQLSNARAIKMLNLGSVMENLDISRLEDLLKKTPGITRQLPIFSTNNS